MFDGECVAVIAHADHEEGNGYRRKQLHRRIERRDLENDQ